MKKSVLLPMAALLAVLVLVAAAGTANAYAYQQRTRGLEQQWADAEAAGMPRAKVDVLRGQLKRSESQRGGTLAYGATSMALVQNPVVDLQRQSQRMYDQVTEQSRAQAQEALAKLKQDHGPTPFDQATYERQLHVAGKPRDFQRLGKLWAEEDQQLVQVRDQLGAKSGGLNNGLPSDVISGRDQLQQTVVQLRQAQLWTDPADQALLASQQYLAASYPHMLAEHDAVKQQLDSGNDRVAGRLNLHNRGSELAGTIPGLLQYGQGGDYASRTDQAKQALNAARNDDQLSAATNSLQGIVNDLRQKKLEAQQRLAAGSSGCENNAAGKLILVSLSRQRLLACDGTTTAYSAPVTSGRPGMETPTGTTTVSFKQTPWLMKPDSTCKQGDPCWYQATQVNYVMLFRSGGYFLHDWPPQEGYAFGPGTQAARFGSHGCVHVPLGVMGQLYDWAPVGTTVIITG
jgi:lipoprotein-anchoring transpeptidase ErfK/SrfK